MQRERGTWTCLVSAGLVGGAWLVALARYGATEPRSQLALFITLALVALWAAWTVPLRALPTRLWLSILAVGGLLLVQVARLPLVTGIGWVHLATGWLTFAVALWITAEEPKVTSLFVWIWVAAGIAQAAYGFLQAVGGVDYIFDYFRDKGRLASGTLITGGHYAGLLAMLFSVSLGQLVVRWELARRPAAARDRSVPLLAAACALMALAIPLARSRGGLLAFFLTVLFVGALVARRSRSPFKRKPSNGRRTAWLLVAAAAAVLALPTISAPDEALDPGLRPAVYRDTVRLILDHPLGVGPGMYRWAFRPYQTVAPGKLFEHAHNDYLETAADWGLPIALAWWCFLLWRCVAGARSFLGSSEPWQRALGLGSAAAIVAILGHSVVDFDLQIPALWMVFAMILGVSWGAELVTTGRSGA